MAHRGDATGASTRAEELAASKMLALFTRAEARDFVDVYALVQRYGFERLCQLAAEKDHGFHSAGLADALGAITRLPRSAFNLEDEALAKLYEAVAAWRSNLAK